MSFLDLKKYQFSFLYALFTAVSVALIQTVKSVPIITSLFICTIIATLFFHAVNWKKLTIVYQSIIHHWMLWLATSITILGVWWCTFYATQNLGAVPFIFIIFITRAISGYCYEIFYKKINTFSQKIALIGMIILFAAMYFLFKPTAEQYIGFLVAALGGIMSYAYGKTSHQLSVKAHLTATQILAVRFYILIAVFIGFIHPSSLKIAVEHHGLALGLITLFSFIIPLYFNQRGISTAGPEAHAIIVACTPALMVLLMAFATHQFSIAQFLISFTIVLFTVPKLLEPLIKEAIPNQIK